MEYATLNNGVKMPMVGLGTFPLVGNKLIETVKMAKELGYELFDKLQFSERQASVSAEHPEDRQPQNNFSACHWHNNNSKEKEASGGNQTLSSIPPQRVHPKGWQQSPEGDANCSQNPQPVLICVF